LLTNLIKQTSNTISKSNTNQSTYPDFGNNL